MVKPLSMLHLGTRSELGMSDVWNEMETVITGLQGILPTVIEDLKFGQTAIQGVAKTINSIFTMLYDKGSPIFDLVSTLYTTIWTVYYVLFVTLTLLVLFYAFWAQGFFGGPTPGIPRDPNEKDERCCSGKTFRERCGTCCNACLGCMRGIQDMHLCFWSCILLSQFIILIMFVIGIVLAIVVGLKAFLGAGCAQIYVLGDENVCTDILSGLQTWLQDFWSEQPSSVIDGCNEAKLTTCKYIKQEMMKNVMYTVICSFAAALFSIQLLFLSAQLHERALWTKKLRDMVADK